MYQYLSIFSEEHSGLSLKEGRYDLGGDVSFELEVDKR